MIHGLESVSFQIVCPVIVELRQIMIQCIIGLFPMIILLINWQGAKNREVSSLMFHFWRYIYSGI